MAGGRPPKPTKIHKQDGTYQPSRHAKRADLDIKSGDMPEPPEILKDDAREMWLDVCEHLPPEVLSRIDVYQLTGMCEMWQHWRDIQRGIDACNDVLDPSYFRLLTMATMAWKHFAAAASRFGMTPSDRAKIKIVEKEKDDGDPLAVLQMRRKGTA